LWRLNELGLLPQLSEVSAVSGGSIAAGVLAVAWKRLSFDEAGTAKNFDDLVVVPIRSLASLTIDRPAIVWGILGPGSVSERIASYYREHLFGETTLQDLPETPRFIFNATNLQTGNLWRFSKSYMGEWQVGRIRSPDLSLAVAVAASSAFPPFLSPVKLHVKSTDFDEDDLNMFGTAEYQDNVLLTDGGVYDNLGLSTKRYDMILVSNAGGRRKPTARPGTSWISQLISVLEIVYDQPAPLRTRMLIEQFAEGRLKGSYWSTRSCPSDYPVSDPIRVDCSLTTQLAETPTRLEALEPRLQEQIINWGYAIADTALRSYVALEHAVDPRLPYPAAPLSKDAR